MLEEAKVGSQLRLATERPLTDFPHLPKSWLWTTIKDVCGKPQYGWTTKASNDGDIKLLRTTDITSGSVCWPSVPYCLNNPENKKKYLLEENDILISRAGSVGKSYIVLNPMNAVFASYLVRIKPRVLPYFVFYYLQSLYYWNQIWDKSSGIAIPNVNGSKLGAITLPLAPLAEQRRIVSRIDELFSKIEAGERAIAAARAGLARYRKAILKAAVTGALTEDWRAQRGEPEETGADLLDRVLKERRTAWEEAELAKLSAKGKPEPKSAAEWTRFRARYKEPAPAAPIDPLCIPSSWTWTNLGQLSLIKGGVTVDRKRQPEIPMTLPYLRVANVQNGHIDLENVKTITIEKSKVAEYLLKPGDILLNEGGDLDKLGRGWVWSGQIEKCIHQNHVFRARPIIREISSRFISFYTNTLGQTFFMERGKQSINLASISLSSISKLPVPLPNIEEQREIVSRLEKVLSRMTAAEVALDAQEYTARALKQSILKAAFEGRLVAQDPNDEPASELLTRVKKDAAA